ncbi:MAG TPA: Gfo/Idh/MocA family oxidoreductase, partial [Thermoleophilaceae bacterium]|nr:Gfo/Idh/MocA family oxidoreductase [Thermoleophilaceae bacterium]
MAERVVNLGLIGGGLMGRELASAAARWVHLDDLGVHPRLVHVCDVHSQALAWYERLADTPRLSGDPRAVLADPEVEAVYIAVPHNLHAELYVAAL